GERPARRGHAAYAALGAGRLGRGAPRRRRPGIAARRLAHPAALLSGLDRGAAPDAGHRLRAGGAASVRLLAADGAVGDHPAGALAGADQHHRRGNGRARPPVRGRADLPAVARRDPAQDHAAGGTAGRSRRRAPEPDIGAGACDRRRDGRQSRRARLRGRARAAGDAPRARLRLCRRNRSTRCDPECGAHRRGRAPVPRRLWPAARGRLMRSSSTSGRWARQWRAMLARLPPARGLLPLVLLLVLWQLIQGGPSPYFPGPAQWWKATEALLDREHLLAAFGATTATFLEGLALAIVLGTALGVLVGISRGAARALQPLLEFMRAIPPPVTVPIATLLIGYSTGMQLTVVVLSPP